MKYMKPDRIFWLRWIVNYSLGELLAIGLATLIGRLLLIELSDQLAHAPGLITPLMLAVIGLAEGWMIGYVQWRSLSRLVVNFKRRLWIVVTMAVMVVGWLIIVPPAIFFISLFIDFHLTAHYYSILYTALAGLCFGSVIGTGQFFVIRRFYKNSMMWVAANSVSWMLSFLLVFFCLSLLEHSGNVFYNLTLIIMACAGSGFVQGALTGAVLHFLMPVQERYKDQPA
jgi:hypothetical protein